MELVPDRWLVFLAGMRGLKVNPQRMRTKVRQVNSWKQCFSCGEQKISPNFFQIVPGSLTPSSSWRRYGLRKLRVIVKTELPAVTIPFATPMWRRK